MEGVKFIIFKSLYIVLCLCVLGGGGGGGGGLWLNG